MLPEPSKSVHSDVLEEPDLEVTSLYPDPAGDFGSNITFCSNPGYFSGGRKRIHAETNARTNQCDRNIFATILHEASLGFPSYLHILYFKLFYTNAWKSSCKNIRDLESNFVKVVRSPFWMEWWPNFSFSFGCVSWIGLDFNICGKTVLNWFLIHYSKLLTERTPYFGLG